MPDPKQLEFFLPAEIDGNPYEVEAAALTQLRTVFGWAAELTNLTSVQVRNSFMTMILNEAPSTTPEELALRWEESDAKASIDRVLTLAAAASAATENAGTAQYE